MTDFHLKLHKVWFLAITGGILVFTGVSRGQDIAANTIPGIACDQPVYDFGQADNRKAINHKFILKNTGTGLLTISRIHACCGASARLGQKTIAPGTNTVLDICLSLRGRKGRMNKSFYIHSNDRLRPIFQLRMIGTGVSMVSSDVMVEPEEIRIPETPATGGSSNLEVTVRSRSGKPFTLFNVELPVCDVEFTILRVNPHEYKIRLRRPLPSEDLQEEELRIETDALGAEEILVPFVIPAGLEK